MSSFPPLPSKILPPPLQPGDLVTVIAPSGALREYAALEKSVEIWRSHGYRVKISDNLDTRHGYLAGTDTHRRHQLQQAWQDPECRAILCARGGFGSTRILEDWHWQQNTAYPKWLIGFSDITALLWSLYNAGCCSVHGPVLTTLLDEPEWSIQRLFDLVEGRPLAPLKGQGWGGGVRKGILLPGNLTVATHLLGTSLLPPLDGVILAFEDVTEPPYRIDRMLTQWRLSGLLSQVCGIALGGFTKCEAPPNIPSLSVEEVLGDRLSDLNIPIVADLPFGHDNPNAALPVGVMATLDAEQGILTIDS
ncbi:peptidase U61 LD-carboxypeptidase A [Richelia sinica FACHB-800]|uniref:Peptidase U61 LD-carboxypeptidase A n=1 Tax=Richelia sinica FACHB-800 TaxID=1357546 RepID=A0A975T827_9NOST|nr:LD-carboxypeptidase [Richelia sinica]MBD2666450.1 LD-carboxypeptidase [Richelia sinica FACHB-800]QXE23800.1 peptidase U61 LD-carboxypeptidase A [Richelia sinica FACHB-800]